MSKLKTKDKENIYKLRKEGKTLSYLASKHGIRKDNISYLIRLIDVHGLEILNKKTIIIIHHIRKKK